MGQYPCNSMGEGGSCGDPKSHSIEHFHGMPNGQSMQVHGNPNALPIKPIHGSPNDQCHTNTIEATWGIPHALPISHFHGAPMGNALGCPWTCIGWPLGIPWKCS